MHYSGISQKAQTTKEPVIEGGAGHACGHHLFGTASTAAGIAVKDWLKKTGTTGTVRVYGTPAEEGGAGKVYITRAGLLNDVDAVLHWHPGNQNLRAQHRHWLINQPNSDSVWRSFTCCWCTLERTFSTRRR